MSAEPPEPDLWHLIERGTRWVRHIHPGVIDAALVVFSFAWTLADLIFDFAENGTTITVPGLIVAALASLALLFRRESPILVLLVALACRLYMVWAVGTELGLAFAAGVALYTVTRNGDRRQSLLIAPAAAVVSILTVAFLDDGNFVEEALSEAFKILLVLVIGDTVRTRAGRFTDRVNAAAALRVQHERLRIARDLHDIVAHGLSNIAVQSGVAARLVDSDPTHAKQALDIINDASRQSLDELRSLLGVLRSSDETVDLQPIPHDPNDLDKLIRHGSQAGLNITTDISGSFPPATNSATVVAVHRIVHEALVNARRHAGPVAVSISVNHTSSGVTVRVVNDHGAPQQTTVPSTGVGIVGMTERAHVAGGSLVARPLVNGGFEVEATVPYLPSGSESHD